MTRGTTSREDRLDDVLADYLGGLAAGRPVGREALLDRHPDLAPELKAFFADREQFDRLAAPLRSLGALRPGRRVGEYEIESEVARGGMGIVYRARHSGLNRTVALKMLRSGALATADQVRRFHAEATAVASLDHPRIVPLYEVGEHDGQPFLVMKFLEGGSLAGKVDDYRANPHSAAAVVAEVADAVHHAHRRGVLHRDLKPSNVLLDADGRPHVSDFGLAKRLDPDPEVTALTRSGELVGTPCYASPEQARGDVAAVTVATDVYGLGTVLYELLTGGAPFANDGGLLEILRRVRDDDPVPPHRLNPAVDVELETVCLKALEKDPSRRYESPAALADDLRRYLANEPVRARPAGTLRRAAQWCRQRPTVTALLATFAIAFGVVAWQWRRAEHNFARAEDNFRQAHEAVNELCLRLDDDRLSRVPGLQPVRRDLLEAGLKYYDRFLAERGGDSTLRAERATILSRVGALNAALGRRREAREATVAALAELERLVQDEPASAAHRATLARVLIRLGQLHADQGEPEPAQSSFARAEQELARLHEADPADVAVAIDLGVALTNQGSLCRRLGRLDDARGFHDRQIALLANLPPAIAARPEVNTRRAAGLNNRATVQAALGRHDEAVATLEEARRLLDAAKGPPTDDARVTLATTLHNLASELTAIRRRPDALRALERELALREQLVQGNPGVPDHVRSLAACLRQTGHLHRDAGALAEAQRCYKEALARMEGVVRLGEASPGARNDLAKCRFDLGTVLSRLGRNADALREFERAARERGELVAADPRHLGLRRDLGLTLTNVSICLGNAGKAKEGRAAADEALEHHRAAFQAAPQVADYRNDYLGASRRVLTLAGKAGDAGRLYSCAGELARTAALPAVRAESRHYQDLAVEGLRAAVRAGFRDHARLRDDPDFEALRGRQDFQQILTELADRTAN